MKYVMSKKVEKTILLALAALLTVFLYTPVTALADQWAVINTISPTWDSGDLYMASVDPLGGPREYRENLLPTGDADRSVVARGEHFYLIGRFGTNFVAKFHVSNPTQPIWQFSTEEVGKTNSNPYDLVFVSDEKAYLLRYGSTKAWIVDPSVSQDQEADFKIGEIDLSAYADGDGVPEMNSGVIVGSHLFITLQRLDNWVVGTSYVLVIDTLTDTVVEQIDLPVPNPQTIQYLDADQTIYIACVGDFFDANVNGGIVVIDPATYDTDLLMNGDPYKGITGLVMVSGTKGYFIGYGDWQSNTLYSFDPTAPAPAGTAITGFQNMELGGMENSVSLDQNGMLWVCNYTDQQVDILNTATDQIDESIDTNLNPSRVVFVSTTDPVPESPDNDDNDSFNCFINTLY